jgi:hypothetical protein
MCVLYCLVIQCACENLEACYSLDTLCFSKLLNAFHICSMQGGPRIAKKDCRSVLFKVALRTELTTYIIRDIAFLGMIRLDFSLGTQLILS